MMHVPHKDCEILFTSKVLWVLVGIRILYPEAVVHFLCSASYKAHQVCKGSGGMPVVIRFD